MSVSCSSGKRKKVAPEAAQSKRRRSPSPSPPSEPEDVNEIFRRAFEAKFKPLKKSKKEEQQATQEAQDIEEADDDVSEWDGISDEDEKAVEVVHVDISDSKDSRPSSKEKRAFMSSKPPTADTAPLAPAKQRPKQATDEDGNTEALNLKNDLALQRLLSESHLLSSGPSSSAAPAGKNRLLATELRLQSLGAKSSVLAQKNMPLSHRKGIAAKAARVESERRQEARENGVVLERPVMKGKKEAEGKRVRGIGGPSVGKFRGGMLRLSERDVRGIQGSGRSRGGAMKRGRGRGRGR